MSALQCNAPPGAILTNALLALFVFAPIALTAQPVDETSEEIKPGQESKAKEADKDQQDPKVKEEPKTEEQEELKPKDKSSSQATEDAQSQPLKTTEPPSESKRAPTPEPAPESAPEPTPEPTPEPPSPPTCEVMISDVKVLRRKLNYQLWDSIEELKPDLLLTIRIGEEVLSEVSLGGERYELNETVSAGEVLCERLEATPIMARVFDQDKGTKRELIAELTTRVSLKKGSQTRTLSGGALRSITIAIKQAQ